MKRLLALTLCFLFVLTLAPQRAQAVDVEPRLEIELGGNQTLFYYGDSYTTPAGVTPPSTGGKFKWNISSAGGPSGYLVVKLYDNTTDHIGGTPLEYAVTEKEPSGGKIYYTIWLGNKLYHNEKPTPAGVPFELSDIGSKTITFKCVYTPNVPNATKRTVTKTMTIAVVQNILTGITATGLSQTEYYQGETVDLAGLAVSATYHNTADPVAIASNGYEVSVTDNNGGNKQAVTEPLQAVHTKLLISRKETYPGSSTVVERTTSVPITVLSGPTAISVKDTTTSNEVDRLDLSAGAASVELTVTPTYPTGVTVPTNPNASLTASVDQPTVASISAEQLTLSSGSKLTIQPLSPGTAIVTVRARGTNISKTFAVVVTAPPIYASKVTLDKTTLDLPVNGTYSLKATVGPEDATDKSVTWDVRTAAGAVDPNNPYVSVDDTGTVKVLQNFTGFVTIRATINGNAPSSTADFAQCTVSCNTIPVDGITISHTSMTLYKGSYDTISAVVTPDNAADPSVRWTSSNEAVATVDENGKVTAVGIPLVNGKKPAYAEAVITAHTSVNSISATCTVKVLDGKQITGLTLNKSSLALDAGSEETLTVSILPTDATNKKLEWVSSNSAIATVDQNGKIIAVSNGSAVIQAKTTDGSNKAVSCAVTVSNIQILNVSFATESASFDLCEGDVATIKYAIYPPNATNQTLKWTSSNTAVATINSKGEVVAGKTKGYSIIKASATDGSGKFAECVVLSKPKVAVTGVTLNYGTELDLMLNDTTLLKGTITPSNATKQTVIWKSSDETICTVDKDGKLSGLKLGTATVTGTADTKVATIKVNVTNTEYSYGVAANFSRRVNVRATPSGLAKLVGYAYRGDTFKILGKTGSWYKIQYNKTTEAYIWAAYINATKTSATYTSAGAVGSTAGTTGGTTTGTTGTTATPTTVNITNCLYAVNVRSGASTGNERIGKAKLGASYPYLGKEGDWYKVQYTNTAIGYIYGNFVNLS